MGSLYQFCNSYHFYNDVVLAGGVSRYSPCKNTSGAKAQTFPGPH
jgi:hypothetical protein